VGRGRREWQEAVDALRRRGALRLHYEDLRRVEDCTGHTAGVGAGWLHARDHVGRRHSEGLEGTHT